MRGNEARDEFKQRRNQRNVRTKHRRVLGRKETTGLCEL